MGLLLALLFDTTSIVLVALGHPRQVHTIQALARWMPPILATCVHLPIAVLPFWRPILDKDPAATFCWLATISVYTHILSD
jgi:hypothetical protein